MLLSVFFVFYIVLYGATEPAVRGAL